MALLVETGYLMLVNIIRYMIYLKHLMTTMKIIPLTKQTVAMQSEILTMLIQTHARRKIHEAVIMKHGEILIMMVYMTALMVNITDCYVVKLPLMLGNVRVI